MCGSMCNNVFSDELINNKYITYLLIKLGIHYFTINITSAI